MANESTPVIRSLLDSDLYKYTSKGSSSSLARVLTIAPVQCNKPSSSTSPPLESSTASRTAAELSSPALASRRSNRRSSVRPPRSSSQLRANHPSTDLADLKLTPSERSWLAQRCPYFSPSYLDYLEAFRFRPAEQIVLAFVVVENDARGVEWGNLELEVKGGWAETILYEVSACGRVEGGS